MTGILLGPTAAGLVAGILGALRLEISLPKSLETLTDFRFYILRNVAIIEQHAFFILEEILEFV
jgi:hypothetical protein